MINNVSRDNANLFVSEKGIQDQQSQASFCLRGQILNLGQEFMPLTVTRNSFNHKKRLETTQ
jgi:hypothetical protein